MTASISLIVITSRFVNEAERRQIPTKAVAVIYQGDLSRETIAKALDEALSAQAEPLDALGEDGDVERLAQYAAHE